MTGAWIAVASAEHVRKGREGNFMQVCHGKAAPLRRVRPGDCVIYYSPTVTFGGKDKLQAFTAIGHVREGNPYQVDMGGGFQPFRKDVVWLASSDAPIQPLLNRLEFVVGARSWGYPFRFGLFPIGDHDREIIGQAMDARQMK